MLFVYLKLLIVRHWYLSAIGPYHQVVMAYNREGKYLLDWSIVTTHQDFLISYYFSTEISSSQSDFFSSFHCMVGCLVTSSSGRETLSVNF